MTKKIKTVIKMIIYIIIIALILSVGKTIYSEYNFNDYLKGVREEGKTSFTRDSEVKYSDTNSYKIENTDYNDSMFYKAIEVTPNTVYKVTCKVKTEDVVNQEGKLSGRSTNCYK